MRIRTCAGAGAAILPALVLAACVSTLEPPETLLWEGVLLVEAGGPPDLSGSAAMVALRAETRAGIGVDGAESGAQFGWTVRSGTCMTPGAAVGPASAFPAVAADGDGTGAAETVLQRRLTGTEYAVQLTQNPDGSGAVLACADLARRT